jgi:kinesin family member 20
VHHDFVVNRPFQFRPVRLHGIEPADATDSRPPQIAPEPALAEVLGHLDVSVSDSDIDPTILKVDRNYEYTIWISYAEVYNEKVYDLLTSVKGDSSMNSDGSNARITSDKALVLARTALPLKPSPPSDNVDAASNGKYIAGLRQFRVHSAMQAKALVKLGQLHRHVFGTLANRESSRSHGMFIIKIVRGHRGERNVSSVIATKKKTLLNNWYIPQDPSALQVSRLTLVDLAGSERTKHTHTTGDRLKEAGNINKSLMVLGQCMEVMRSNQRKLAISLSKEGIGKEGRMDTKYVKKGLAVVPFRHSKLTEALMDYFVGDGRAVSSVWPCRFPSSHLAGHDSQCQPI